MKAEENINLSWCKKHNQWWVMNCPECMLEFNETEIRKQGRQEVVDWIYANKPHGDDNYFEVLLRRQLKEWGIYQEKGGK